jgi:hypothetical protein
MNRLLKKNLRQTDFDCFSPTSLGSSIDDGLISLLYNKYTKNDTTDKKSIQGKRKKK